MLGLFRPSASIASAYLRGGGGLAADVAICGDRKDRLGGCVASVCSMVENVYSPFVFAIKNVRIGMDWL